MASHSLLAGLFAVSEPLYLLFPLPGSLSPYFFVPLGAQVCLGSNYSSFLGPPIGSAFTSSDTVREQLAFTVPRFHHWRTLGAGTQHLLTASTVMWLPGGGAWQVTDVQYRLPSQVGRPPGGPGAFLGVIQALLCLYWFLVVLLPSLSPASAHQACQRSR